MYFPSIALISRLRLLISLEKDVRRSSLKESLVPFDMAYPPLWTSVSWNSYMADFLHDLDFGGRRLWFAHEASLVLYSLTHRVVEGYLKVQQYRIVGHFYFLSSNRTHDRPIRSSAVYLAFPRVLALFLTGSLGARIVSSKCCCFWMVI